MEAKKIIVMAYEAPYYLDTTEVSKLTAYYGVYSRMQPFIDASARALFLEYAPTGRSPVIVDGVGYDLARQLSPDPDQVIEVDVADQPAPVDGTPTPIELEVGDTLHVRTNVIVDYNGNPVPDGTPVTFHAFYVEEQLERRVETETVEGVANASITLEVAGEIEIRATSEPATNSRFLVVLLGETTQIVTPTPVPTATSTPTPTPTPTFTPTPTPTWTPTPTPTVTPEPEPEPPPPLPEPRLQWLDLVLALAGMLASSGIIVLVGRGAGLRARTPYPLIRAMLWVGICSLGLYLYYGLGWPGSNLLDQVPPGFRGLILGSVGGLVLLIPVLLLSWRGRRENSRP